MGISWHVICNANPTSQCLRCCSARQLQGELHQPLPSLLLRVACADVQNERCLAGDGETQAAHRPFAISSMQRCVLRMLLEQLSASQRAPLQHVDLPHITKEIMRQKLLQLQRQHHGGKLITSMLNNAVCIPLHCSTSDQALLPQFVQRHVCSGYRRQQHLP